jgi:DNA anti-recombination protein RmuC
MCGANKRFFLYLLLALLFSCVVGALRGEGQESWYLISETELRVIEEYKMKSEAEKRTWLLQVQGLRTESKTLNSQLASQRELNRELRQSFDEYEAALLILISSKNGEIAVLNQALSEQVLKTEKHERAARSRLKIIITLSAAGIALIAFKLCRFFRLF